MYEKWIKFQFALYHFLFAFCFLFFFCNVFMCNAIQYVKVSHVVNDYWILNFQAIHCQLFTSPNHEWRQTGGNGIDNMQLAVLISSLNSKACRSKWCVPGSHTGQTRDWPKHFSAEQIPTLDSIVFSCVFFFPAHWNLFTQTNALDRTNVLPTFFCQTAAVFYLGHFVLFLFFIFYHLLILSSIVLIKMRKKWNWMGVDI